MFPSYLYAIHNLIINLQAAFKESLKSLKSSCMAKRCLAAQAIFTS
jgi:hypothetical protein